jgi:primosomal protein N'
VDVEHLADVALNKCLSVIEDSVLALGGQPLKEYGLPEPSKSEQFDNREYLKETSYDLVALEDVVKNNEESLNDEQKFAYNQIITSVNNNEGRIYFLDAPDGTGKTFLINLILAKVRSTRDIAVASSGIAATLLEGGRTAHATFKLPLNLTTSATPFCNISKQSNFAEVLKDTKLIVWDEITMAHKGGVEVLNRSLKDIRENKMLMGGVTVLLAGDFRQTLPVVPKGTRTNEVKSCLKRSTL